MRVKKRHARHLPPVLCFMGLCSVLTPAAQIGVEARLTVDGSQTFQTIDGFGVNANPKNWYDGQLIPALDMLTDDLHATIWRVDIFGKSDWEVVNDDDDPFHFNWEYYNDIYSRPPFQDLWNTLAYLNGKNVQILLSASGTVPDWMGGTVIWPDMEDEWVEEIVSVLYYARNAKNIQFTMIDPFNEIDLGPPEGPNVDPVQCARLLNKLAFRLNDVGMGDIRIVPPQTVVPEPTSASIARAPSFRAYQYPHVSDPASTPSCWTWLSAPPRDFTLKTADFDCSYLDPIFMDATVMAQIDHLGFHNYGGYTDDLYSYIQESSYPSTNFWLTEYGNLDIAGVTEWQNAVLVTDHLLCHLAAGASAGLDWDAYDNVHDHIGMMTYWGKLGWNRDDGTYTPRKKFYTDAVIYRNVLPGSVRIASSSSLPSLLAVAFYDVSSGRVVIVGHNTEAGPVTLRGTLTNLPAVSTLYWYETNATVDLQKRSDIVVEGNAFVAEIGPDTFFAIGTP